LAFTCQTTSTAKAAGIEWPSALMSKSHQKWLHSGIADEMCQNEDAEASSAHTKELQGWLASPKASSLSEAPSWPKATNLAAMSPQERLDNWLDVAQELQDAAADDLSSIAILDEDDRECDDVVMQEEEDMGFWLVN